MTKNPPNRRGIVFEVGAQLEARDRLKKWYAALIEEINFEEGKVLIHFKHWNHRHDEWFCWDSPDLRPEDKIQLRKEGLHVEPVQPEFRVNQQVLACWSDCRFYPAKITATNKDGSYTVKFFDGIVQTIKSIHVKAFSKDQSNVTIVKPIARNKEITSRVEKQKEKCNEQRNSGEKIKKEPDERSPAVDERPDPNKLVAISEKSNEEPDKCKLVVISEKSKNDPEKEKLVANSEKSKVSEIHSLKNVKEDKENISENDKESLSDKQIDENKIENLHKARHESRSIRRKRNKPPASPSSDPASQTLQPLILELRRRKIAIAVEVQSKRPRLEKNLNDLPSIEYSEKPTKPAHSGQCEEKLDNSSDTSEKAQTPRRSSRLSGSGKHEMLHIVHVTPVPLVVEPLKEAVSSPNETSEDDLPSFHSSEKATKPAHSVQQEEKLDSVTDSSGKVQTPRRSSRRSSTGSQEMIHVVHLTPAPSVFEPLKEEPSSPNELPEDLPSVYSEKSTEPARNVKCEAELNNSSDNSERAQIPRRSSRLFSSDSQEIVDEVHTIPAPAVCEPLDEQASTPNEPPEDSSFPCDQCPSLETNQLVKSEDVAEIVAAELSSTALEIKTENSDSPKAAEGKVVAAIPVTIALKKNNEPLASKVLSNDLDHSKFKCRFKDCSKFFRKAKLLHYHMKYFHGVEKAEQAHRPVTRSIQTRSLVASEKGYREIPKRRRTTSGSLHTPLHLELRGSPSDDKTDKRNEKRRHSVPCSHTLNTHRPLLREKSKDNQNNKPHRKQPDREKRNYTAAKDKEKYKEKKSKDILRTKVKKKKKKKKKSKSEYSGVEENIEVSRELTPKKSLTSIKSSSTHKAPYCLERRTLPSTDLGHVKDQVKKNEEDTLSDSSADSLLWSDDEYSQEIDVTTNPEEGFDEDERDFDIVRCMCEVQEENDFMIQCEECLCWQHGVCMGLLEDNVPEKYMCYICRDPPGQRSGMKYWYDKEWLNNGHMLGLSFLEENYSHQNAKKIVATHQLLGDVHRVIELLHGLQLKMSILQSKDHPDLKLWCLPWKPHTMDEKCYPKHSFRAENCFKEDTINYRTFNGAVEKPYSIPSVEESYITSEHCYQKPRAYYPAIEQRLVVETRGSAVDDGVNRIRENGDDAVAERLGWALDRDKGMMDSDSKHNYCKVRECLSKNSSEEVIEMKLMENNVDGVLNTQIQWQLNLLNHVESLQDEVTHRMDFIEKELDVLESFLDYTGELEPPEPLARLPQLKLRVKQLLMDLGKVQQITLRC